MENNGYENDDPKDGDGDVDTSEIVFCSDFERGLDPMILISLKSNTKLLESIVEGDITYMRSLMAMGANLNATSRLGRVTACHIAACRQDNDALDLLLRAGADSSRTDQYGRTPLHLAAWAGYVKQIAVLLNFPEALRNSLVDHVIWSPETMAEVTRHSLPVNKLTNLPCRSNVASVLPGDWCSGADHYWPSLQKMLPEFELKGWTALHAASARANLHCVELLLAAGADVSAQDFYYRTPVDVAGDAHYMGHRIDENIFMETVYLLLKAGGQFSNHGDSGGIRFHTPLHTAVELESEAAVNYLLQNGASPTVWNSYGLTALHVCVEKRNKELLQILASHESSNMDSNIAAIDVRSSTGRTVLHDAVKNEWLEGVQIALSAGATNIKETVHAVDHAGQTPIYEACRQGNKEIIALLLRNGADLSGEENENEKKLPIEMLMINVSKPTNLLREVFNTNIIRYKGTEDEVFVDFRVLLPKCGMKKMKVIQTLLDTGNTYDQQSLLLHPLVESFLYLQWRSLLPFFYIILALHVCFVLSLNVFALSLFWCKDRNIEPVPIVFRSSAWVYIIYVTAFLLTMQEVIVIKIKTMRNLLSFETSVKWLSTIFAVVLPQVVSWDSKYHPEWVRLFGSVTLLLTWVRVMYLLSRLPGYGYYVLMYGKVATKVFKILASLGFLIVGFCVSFMIQFHAQPPFEDLFSSLLTTMVMMSSELGYNEVMNKENVEHASASLIMIRLIFVLFLILVSIILMNLLVGVAVNDVNTLEIIGNINRLKKQVQFIKSFEDAGSYNFIKGILGKWFDDSIFKISCIPLQSLEKYGLPTHLIDAIFENSQLQKWQWDEMQSTELFQTKLDEVHQIIVNKNTFVPTEPDIPDNEGKVLRVVSEVLEEIVKLRTDMELIKNRIGEK